MIGIHDVPEQWLNVLSTIQTVFPEAILAGGCLRDLQLGGEVKDLDVFVKSSASSVAQMEDLAQQMGWRIGTGFNGSYGNFNNVAEAYQYHVPGLPYPVQVIFLTSDPFNGYEVLKRMDFGACQIGTEGKFITYTGEAHADLTNRRITLNRAETVPDVAQSLRRADRFREKYAGTDVVIDTSACKPGALLLA